MRLLNKKSAGSVARLDNFGLYKACRGYLKIAVLGQSSRVGLWACIICLIILGLQIFSPKNERWRIKPDEKFHILFDGCFDVCGIVTLCLWPYLSYKIEDD